jgi:dihydrodipicolinate synthase/N-acetylneuraminate lyase
MPLPPPDGQPVVVAPTTTPFHADESVDHDQLAQNVERWCRAPAAGSAHQF